MSREATNGFIEAWGNRDPRVEEALKDQSSETLNDPESLCSIAIGLGYDVTSEELIQAFADRRKKTEEILDGEVLSLDELEQVTGGVGPCSGADQRCSSDYNPNDTCWHDDRCLNSWHYYKKHKACASTYEEDEQCVDTDNCSAGAHAYT